jgi:gamma-glutamyltranspeptidase/glutathione hydrolase
MLLRSGQLAVVGAVGSKLSFAADSSPPVSPGLVAGQPKAAEVGNKILRDGGNAIDAAVAAALTAGVVAPLSCGIGGYGGHMMIAFKGGRKITAIDFNSTAPAAARADMFPLGKDGKVLNRANDYGWLATGVPGTLAGLQLALNRYGMKSFRELVGPALRLAGEGFPLNAGLANGISRVAAQLRKDPGSLELFFKDGQPLRAGETLRNPDLAKMLETLARENSVEAFYRGDIARHIANEFQKNGGLVTAKDLSDYRAREVEPMHFEWRGFTVRTPPPTSGGLTVLQALGILKSLEWEKWPATPRRSHALIEALRLAWHDRLTLLGDPAKASVPLKRLLSKSYLRSLAAQVEKATQDHRILPLQTDARAQTGTIHLNSADRMGNVVALTLTHGNAFGACVTVDGLGLTLGHGLSRFDPHPPHPNAPGPGKRPLHNMCPTIVLRDDRPVLAIGGTGGRLIPNSVFTVLTHVIGLAASLEDAIAAPRLHTEGNVSLTLEPGWPEAEVEVLKGLGYSVKAGNGANVHALALQPQGGTWRPLAR